MVICRGCIATFGCKSYRSIAMGIFDMPRWCVTPIAATIARGSARSATGRISNSTVDGEVVGENWITTGLLAVNLFGGCRRGWRQSSDSVSRGDKVHSRG